jgi:hypothetical protein
MEFNNSYIKVTGIAVVITLVLTALVFIHYAQISKRQGSLVIPAGNTYLGPNAPAQSSQVIPTNTANIFTAAPDVPWHDVHGRIYPYTFSAPTTLTLTTFNNDPYDISAISCCGIDPGSNVLIGVDFKANPNQQKLAYVQNWWHQFSGLKSVSSIDEFTNSKGLKGYKAKFVNSAGETPNLDVFFEVPGHPELVIHLASGTLDPAVFTKIVDSVSWK